MKIRFHAAAEQELAAAVTRGEGFGPGLGLEILEEANRVAALLCVTPRIGEPLDAFHRAFPLRRFPYRLIYRIDDNALMVVAVAHLHQKPGYWRERK